MIIIKDIASINLIDTHAVTDNTNIIVNLISIGE